MKPILIFLTLFISGPLFSQKPFQGTVIYNLTATGEKSVLELKVHFGARCLKIVTKEINGVHGDEPVDKYLLVNFDSGKVFTVRVDRKTYGSENILEKNTSSLQPRETKIANYAVSPVVIKNQASGIFLPVFSGETIFYKSDLYYPVSNKYEKDERLLFIYDNHILLGADIAPGMGRKSDMGNLIITARAISVTSESFSKDFFQLPEGYKPEDNTISSRTDSIDSVAAAPDSLEIITDTTIAAELTRAIEEKKDNGKQQPITQERPDKTPAVRPKKPKS
jgi:hypothetical protein